MLSIFICFRRVATHFLWSKVNKLFEPFHCISINSKPELNISNISLLPIDFQRDTTGLTNENKELKLRLQANKQNSEMVSLLKTIHRHYITSFYRSIMSFICLCFRNLSARYVKTVVIAEEELMSFISRNLNIKMVYVDLVFQKHFCFDKFT